MENGDRGNSNGVDLQQEETHEANNDGTKGSSALLVEHTGQELAFKDVSVTVGGKEILQKVSGMACPGEMLAIMGPSGAGKTTLLNTLACRLPLESGEITLNGAPLNKHLKRKISYVLQEDVFFPNLTLRETLRFVTMLRLPEKMSKQDKLTRMEEAIDALDLRKCLDTPIGDAWMRGLSGGEKKRASIACELITDPKIFYLDEPTSGLDYSTALSVVGKVKNVAMNLNKTVVMTIHQPSSQIFFLFNKLLLLCDGKMAYYGKCRDVIDFFSDLNMHIDAYMNPADFVVEKLRESSESRNEILAACEKLRSQGLWSDALKSDTAKRNADLKDAADDSAVRFSATGFAKKRKASGENGTDDVRVSLMELDKESSDLEDQRWPTGFWTQYTQLTLRSFRQSKSRIFDKMKIVENLLICILVSLVWFQLPRSEDTLRDRMGALFFISIHWAFTPLFDAVSSFPAERVVIQKERAAHWYRLSAYYLAKTTSELPLILLQPALFVLVTYWCIGLNGFKAFLATVCVIMVNSVTGQSIGLFMGIMSMDFRRAMVMATIFIMTFMLLGGFYTRNLPFWLEWIKYGSFLFYSFHSVFYLELWNAGPMNCAKKVDATHFPSCLEANVTQVEASQILSYYEMDWPFAAYFLPLFGFIIVFRLAGYLALRYLHRPHA